jgi:homogentisate 1,2-dioxygenase
MNVMQQLTPAQSRAAELTYLSGFGNGFETEALPGALPVGRNSPKKCAGISGERRRDRVACPRPP